MEHNRSNPNAIPPCGGAPNSNASIRNPNCFLRFFFRKAKVVEHHLLCRPIVDTNGSATYFSSVDHHVVSIRADVARLTIQQFYILGFWRCERVVHGMITFRFFAPLQQREVKNPQGRKLLLVAKSQSFTHKKAKFVELLACRYLFHLPAKNKVTGLGIKSFCP